MKKDLRIEVLETRRLRLRPFKTEDGERLTELLQDPEIHRWTSSIPYPYTLDHAREFLELLDKDRATGASFVWAITDLQDGSVLGAMGLHDVKPDSGNAELGYWLGKDYRGLGYATEAARRVISWCFEVGEFHRIQASYFPGNQASEGVMRNIGMREEGLLRGYGYKNGVHQDIYMNAILRSDPAWIPTKNQLD